MIIPHRGARPASRHSPIRVHQASRAIPRDCLPRFDPGRVSPLERPWSRSGQEKTAAAAIPIRTRAGELEEPCPIPISVWPSTPGSPASNRPRRIRSPASSRPSSGASPATPWDATPSCASWTTATAGASWPARAGAAPGPGRRRAIDRLYMLDPDRLSRKYAYQVLILEELAHCGVEAVFLRNPVGRGPRRTCCSRSRA